MGLFVAGRLLALPPQPVEGAWLRQAVCRLRGAAGRVGVVVVARVVQVEDGAEVVGVLEAYERQVKSQPHARSSLCPGGVGKTGKITDFARNSPS